MIDLAKLSDTYFVRPIGNCGDGEPGPEQKVHAVTRFNGPSDAAEFFVSMLTEMFKDRWGEEHCGQLHGMAYTVGVRHPEESTWHRFVVKVRVKLEFEAKPVEARAKETHHA